MLEIHSERWNLFFDAIGLRNGKTSSAGVPVLSECASPGIPFAVVAKVHDEFAEVNPLLFQVIPEDCNMILNKLSDLFAAYFNRCFHAFRNGDEFDLYPSERWRIDDDAGGLTPFGP